jgi:hypothetical protein
MNWKLTSVIKGNCGYSNNLVLITGNYCREKVQSPPAHLAENGLDADIYVSWLIQCAMTRPFTSANLTRCVYSTRLVNRMCTYTHRDIFQILFSHNKYRTYFIEYEFPVATDHGCGQAEKNDIGLEITRIATKKTTAKSRS